MSERQAARVVLVDERDRVLLFHGTDPDRADGFDYWFTPGGGVEAGESVEEAARREVREEVGVDVADLGPVVHEDDVDFVFQSERFVQHQHWFVVGVAVTEVDEAGWTPLERRTVTGHRWWTLAELEATEERVYPEDLLDLIRRSGPPRR